MHGRRSYDSENFIESFILQNTWNAVKFQEALFQSAYNRIETDTEKFGKFQ